MNTGDARIVALTDRLSRLEKKTADETAAIRSELFELARLRDTAPAAAPVPMPIWPPPMVAAQPRKTRDFEWLTGPRGLALAGGIVTLLGIVFVFVLAASRGWIDPAVRCSIGGGVSVLLVVMALLARRRIDRVVAGLAAAGAGIGGLYVTLYAASRGYHLLGTGVVWAGVLVVAGLAVALGLAWSSELLGVLGLVAVVVAPPIVDHRLTGIGLGVSAIAAAAALGMGRQRGWRLLGGLAYSPALAQTLVFVGEARHGAHAAALLASISFVLALAGAAGYQRRGERPDWFVAALASVSLPLALFSIWSLARGADGRGTSLLVVAAGYTLASRAFWRFLKARETAELLAAFALIAAALATAAYLSNAGLLAAWTVEGVALTALAARGGERRYQAAGLAYLALAAGHLFTFETPLTHLFSARSNPAQHIGGVLLLGLGLSLTALLVRGREHLFPRLDLAAVAGAGLLGLYAVSLTVLDFSQRLGGANLHSSFQRGETLVSALWALVALAALSAGLARRSKELRYSKELRSGGLGLLGLSLAKLFLFDLAHLSSLTRAGSFLAVGLALLAGGYLVQRLASHAPPAT